MDRQQPQFYDTLASVARSLNEYPQTLVDVVGHADSIGRPEYNQQLSERRALAVADNLTNRGGVLRDRLYVAGRGSDQPIASNATEEGRAKNRRVEIILRPLTS
jgi:outer membrane protein OmpA-like peptidoglycan-associated protein